MHSRSKAKLTLLLSRRRGVLLLPLLPVSPLSVHPLAHVPQEGGRRLVLAVAEGGGGGWARDVGCGHEGLGHCARIAFSCWGEKLRCKRKWRRDLHCAGGGADQGSAQITFCVFGSNLLGPQSEDSAFQPTSAISGPLYDIFLGKSRPGRHLLRRFTLFLDPLSNRRPHFSDRISDQCSIQCP